MNTSHPYGFRIVGPCTGDRRRVDAATAFDAYRRCDPKARVESEAYLSAFQFGDEFAEHLAREGTPKGFAGSTWSPFVWLDIDREPSAGGIPRALADTRDLVDVLDESFGVPRDVLVPFVSGGKGFHVGIPTALWLPPAGDDFHAVARAFAESIAGEAKVVIDTCVFDRVRAFRAPNSRHPRTGLYKRHVPVGLLGTATADDLLALAREPAPFDLLDVAGVESVDMLVAEWDRAAAVVAERAEAAAQRRRDLAEGKVVATLNRATLAFIRGEDVTSRHPRLYSAAANLAEVGCSRAAVHALLTEPALDLGLPPSDVVRTIDNGIARVVAGGVASAHPLVEHAVDVLGAKVVGIEYPDEEGRDE
jgi:hypothetical protein